MPESGTDPVASLRLLWEEAQIEKRNAELFLSCLDDLPEGKALAVLDFETQQVRQGTSLLQKIARVVGHREEAVSLLHYLGDLYSQSPGLLGSKVEVRKCAETIAKLRLYSLQVVEGIEKWKGILSSLLALQPEKQVELVYIWGNDNYYAKMRTDLDFLCDSPISTCFAFSANDPFLMLCSHCGSAPQYSQASRLVHLPSDSGKHLVPVPKSYQGRMRLADVVVLEQGGWGPREEALPVIVPPKRPNGGRFSISARRQTPPKEALTSLVDPRVVAERVFDGLITAIESEELRFMCQDAVSATRTELKSEVAKRIAEKYTEDMVAESLVSAIRSVFSELTRAKLLLHSSTILDSIVTESIKGEIPLIALESIREEKGRESGAAVDRYIQDLIAAQIRATVAETVRDCLVAEMQEKIQEEGMRAELRILAREEVEDYERQNARPIEELVDAEMSGLSAEEGMEVPAIVVIPESSTTNPVASTMELETVIADDLLNQLAVDEMREYLEGKIEKQAVKMENELQYLSSEVAKSLLSQVLAEFDYYSIAEEMGFAELSASSLPLASKTSLLEQWRVERLCREVYKGLVHRWSEELWVVDLCHKQFQQAYQAPKLHLSNSQLRVEERIDYVMETFTSSMHSPKSYTPGVSHTMETYHSPSPSEPCFPDASKLELMLAFASDVELEPIEVWEDDLSRILFTYMQLLQPPMDGLVPSVETLLQTIRSSLNPQWYWLTVEGKVVGMTSFRDDPTQWDRVVCEHFSVLDFRYWASSVDEVLRWALRDYNEVRMRVYYEDNEPSQYKSLLASKELKWKRTLREGGLNCLEMGKNREGEQLSPCRGLAFEHSSLVDPQDLELVLSGMFGCSELSAELMELESLKYLQHSEGRLKLSGRLRLLGSECRLVLLLGRLCRCLRVQPEVICM